jgi:hypothetical protein
MGSLNGSRITGHPFNDLSASSTYSQPEIIADPKGIEQFPWKRWQLGEEEHRNVCLKKLGLGYRRQSLALQWWAIKPLGLSVIVDRF